MSSSAPKLQAASDASPFAYAEVTSPSIGSLVSESPEESIRHQNAEAFEQGRQSTQQQLRSELDAVLAKNRDEIGRALREFSVERQNYYRRIEGEVVGLALAVARKILHREVQLDPHALAGIVKVTLEKLDTGTKVNLRVFPAEATEWRHYFACQMGDIPVPEVHEDPTIPAGVCRIETTLGSTEVGLEAQLKEIETGLFDLLAETPGARSHSSSSSTRTASSSSQSTANRVSEEIR